MLKISKKRFFFMRPLRRSISRLALAVLVPIVLFSPASISPVIASPELWTAEGWTKTNFSKHSVAWSEIISGGPGKDGIPPIDHPKFQPAHKEFRVAEHEAVIGLEINGDARAYPISLLMWHEIVNDKVGGVPVSVTYCPLCNAAIVFDRRLQGRELSFGTSGKLRKSDLVMYDRQTESWWQQFSGQAIVGELTGKKLRIIGSRLEGFAHFKARYPSGKILVPNDPSFRAYGRNPYEGYDSSKVPFLFRGELPMGINPMLRVVVIRDPNGAQAVTLAHLVKVGRFDLLGVTLSWVKGQASALDHHTVAGGRDVGNVIAQKVASDGSSVDVPYDVTFAFVFHAFHPDVEIITH